MLSRNILWDIDDLKDINKKIVQLSEIVRTERNDMIIQLHLAEAQKGKASKREKLRSLLKKRLKERWQSLKKLRASQIKKMKALNRKLKASVKTMEAAAAKENIMTLT